MKKILEYNQKEKYKIKFKYKINKDKYIMIYLKK